MRPSGLLFLLISYMTRERLEEEERQKKEKDAQFFAMLREQERHQDMRVRGISMDFVPQLRVHCAVLQSEEDAQRAKRWQEEAELAQRRKIRAKEEERRRMQMYVGFALMSVRCCVVFTWLALAVRLTKLARLKCN